MTQTPKSGMVARIAELLFRYDVGVLLSRASLFIPVWLLGREMADPVAFGEASAVYHSCLFLTSISLFGLHEAMVVDDRARVEGPGLVLLLSALVGALGYAAWVLGWIEYSWPVFLFLIGFRNSYLVSLAYWRRDPVRYLIVCLALVVSGVLLLMVAELTWSVVLPLYVLFLVVLWRVGAARDHRFVLPWAAAWRYRHYGGNFLLSTIYIQGALFLYSILARDLYYAFATNFVYLMAAVFVAMDLVYRRILADRESKGMSRAVVVESLVVLAACATGFTILLVLLGTRLESLLLGRALVTSDGLGLGLLTALVFVHAGNFIGAGLLVAMGRMPTQMRINMGMAAWVASFILVGDLWGSPYVLPLSLLTASALGLAIRLRVLRALSLGATG